MFSAQGPFDGLDKDAKLVTRRCCFSKLGYVVQFEKDNVMCVLVPSILYNRKLTRAIQTGKLDINPKQSVCYVITTSPVE